jgi:hypothetical protein
MKALLKRQIKEKRRSVPRANRVGPKGRRPITPRQEKRLSAARYSRCRAVQPGRSVRDDHEREGRAAYVRALLRGDPHDPDAASTAEALSILTSLARDGRVERRNRIGARAAARRRGEGEGEVSRG